MTNKKYRTLEERQRATNETKMRWHYRKELKDRNIVMPKEATISELKGRFQQEWEREHLIQKDVLHDAIKTPNPQGNKKVPDISPFLIEDMLHEEGVFKDGIAPLIYGIGGKELDVNGKELPEPEDKQKKSPWKFT